jgi:hypothetical protein
MSTYPTFFGCIGLGSNDIQWAIKTEKQKNEFLGIPEKEFTTTFPKRKKRGSFYKNIKKKENN